MKKIMIIGGGASGLTTAINAKDDNNEVFILEKNSSCGKKILVTGNGRCNYYNDDQDLRHYHSTNNELISRFISINKINKIIPFFESLGIYPEIKDGYYYPKSNQAISIKNALELECINKGVKIINDITTIDIKKDNNRFIITTDKGKYEADIVIISTGSKASIKNEKYNGYNLASSLGHSIIKPLPGLVQLISKNKLKEASGVRVKACLSLLEDNKHIKDEIGELQITDYGISGIVAMQLSSNIARGLDENKKEEIIINFLPGINDTKMFIDNLNSRLKNRTISEILDGLLNYKLVNTLLKNINIQRDSYYDSLTNNQKELLINNLSSYKIDIEDTKGFMNAQICSGGVPLTEIKENFESKLVDNLYFTGEVIDINGDCGGYNLSFAWLSGIIVGEDIKNKEE